MNGDDVPPAGGQSPAFADHSPPPPAKVEGPGDEPPMRVGRLTKFVVKNPGIVSCAIFLLTVILSASGIFAIIATSEDALDAIGFGEYRVQGDPLTLQNAAFSEVVADRFVPGDDEDDEDDEDDPDDPNRRELVRSQRVDSLTIVYEDLGDDENMLTEEHVADIVRVEGALLDTRWDEFCRLEYKEGKDKVKKDPDASKDARCASPNSILQYLFEGKKAHKKQCEEGYCFLSKDSLGSCGTFIDWGTFPCRSKVYSWRDGELAKKSNWGKILKEQLCDDSFSRDFILDKEAVCKKAISKHLRSSYTLGGPLSGFKNTDEEGQSQIGGVLGTADSYGTEMAAAMSSSVDEVSATSSRARTYVSMPSGDKDVNVLYFSFTTGRIFETLLSDTYLASASVVFVFCYIWSNVGSLFLAFAGIFEIIASLPLALFFWRVVLQQTKVEILQFLTVYLILCIGSDDIFVFMDSWKESKTAGPRVSDSIETRLVFTYKQAVNAMFTTTMTTVLSLVTTSFSSIPAISTFGIFAALVVIWDFLLVCSWFPAMVVFYATYIERASCSKWCCACFPCCRVSPEPEAGEKPEERRIVVWLRETLAPLIFRYRYACIAVAMVGVISMGATFGALFKLAEDLPNNFVPENPSSVFNDIQDDSFFVPEDWKYQVSVAYGLDVEEPITYQPDGQISPTTDRESELRFVPLNLNKNLQEKLVKDCNRARRDEDLVSKKESYCLLNDLKEWAGDDFPFEDEAELRKGLDKFYDSSEYSWLTANFSDYTTKTGFVADGDEGIKVYFVSYNTTIPPEANSGPNVLLPYFNQWEAYAEDCATDCFHMTTGGEGPASWVLFRIFQQLFREVGITVVASLLLAFVVLVMTTRNWIVSIYVVFTILCIIVCVFGSVVSRGFEIGVQECIYIALTIGLSVDYAVHLTHFYVHATGTRFERTQEAMSKILISILGGATTTAVAALPLFACVQTFLYLYGFFILFTSLWSFLLSILLLVPLLMTIGPEGDQGTFKSCADFLGQRGVKICQDTPAADEPARSSGYPHNNANEQTHRSDSTTNP